MKLTQEEIKFIDNYLVKNKVKFWDVRLELLDHIVSAVEDKMENKGVSFNEALLDVHHGFGNQIDNGYTYDLDFNKVLFIDNKGFKKFQIQEQNQIRKKQFKSYKQTFLPFVTSLHFWLELLVLVLIVVSFYTYFNHKVALMALLVAIVITYLSKFFISGLQAWKAHSLNMETAVLGMVLVLALPALFTLLFNWYFEDAVAKPYYLLILLFFGIYIFSRHSYNNFRSIHNTYKKRYTLLMS